MEAGCWACRNPLEARVLWKRELQLLDSEVLLCFRVNVCGGQCCHGWSKAPGSQRCTKRKFPCSQRPCTGKAGLFTRGRPSRGHVKGANAVLDKLVSGVQSTPLSAAFVTPWEGLGQGRVGINASSKLLFEPCSQDSSALNSLGFNHWVTPVNQKLGRNPHWRVCHVTEPTQFT